MENYPDFETYRALYARYYQREAVDLLRLLEPLQGMCVMDLCGGDGRLTFEMLASGAESVCLVDAEPKMISPEIRQLKHVQIVIKEVRFALSAAIRQGEYLDRIVCQQAVNYWLDEDMAQAVAAALKPGGIFAFNTFNQCPPEKPRVLEYELDGHSFVEVSWRIGDDVHHLQVRSGLQPHQTVFLWLSEECLRELLEPYFVVHEDRRGKTSLYRCEKK
jgi:SAM-dependent methyltransferase